MPFQAGALLQSDCIRVEGFFCVISCELIKMFNHNHGPWSKVKQGLLATLHGLCRFVPWIIEERLE